MNVVEPIREKKDIVKRLNKCPAGVLTIGYGHTNNVRLDDVLTQDEAEKLLDIDIKIKENELNKLIKVPVTQNHMMR